MNTGRSPRRAAGDGGVAARTAVSPRRRGLSAAAAMCMLASTVALAVIPAASPAGAHDVKGDLSSNTAQTATEGSTFTFEVCRNSTKNDNFLWTQNVVGYMHWQVVTSGAYTASAADFTKTSGTEQFGTGDTCIDISVATVDDSIHEGSETFQLKLTKFEHKNHSPDGLGGINKKSDGSVELCSSCWKGTVGGTITDNDLPNVTVSVSDATVTEGGDLTFTFTATGDDVGSAFSINAYVSNVTAESSDYTYGYVNQNRLVQFSGTSGATNTITLFTNDDSLVEGDETVRMSFSSATTRATLTLPDPVTGTITDNDAATFTIADVTVNEGANATYTVSLSGGIEGGAKVKVTHTGNTATSHVDYFEDGARQLTFTGTSGESKTGGILTKSDVNTSEGDETIDLAMSLQDPVTGATISMPGVNVSDTATITIKDGPATVPTLLISDASATEGGNLDFRISLNMLLDTSSGAFTVGIAPQSTSTLSSSDYSSSFECYDAKSDGSIGSKQTYTVVGRPAGQACLFDGNANEVKWLRVVTNQDKQTESTENLNVSLTYKFYTQFGTPENFTATDTAVGTVTDDD